jgi:putative ABC transport system permease protein
LDANVPPRCYSAGEIVDGSLGYRRFVLLLVAVLGIAALLLAGIGIYGVTAFAVPSKTPQIGVRMAMGAHAADVLRLVFGDGYRSPGSQSAAPEPSP